MGIKNKNNFTNIRYNKTMDTKIERYFELFKIWKEANNTHHELWMKIYNKKEDVASLRRKILNEPTDIGDFIKYFEIVNDLKKDIKAMFVSDEKMGEASELMHEVEKMITPPCVPDNNYLSCHDKYCSLI